MGKKGREDVFVSCGRARQPTTARVPCSSPCVLCCSRALKAQSCETTGFFDDETKAKHPTPKTLPSPHLKHFLPRPLPRPPPSAPFEQYPSLPCVRIGSASKHNYIPMEVCHVRNPKRLRKAAAPLCVSDRRTCILLHTLARTLGCNLTALVFCCRHADVLSTRTRYVPPFDYHRGRCVGSNMYVVFTRTSWLLPAPKRKEKE